MQQFQLTHPTTPMVPPSSFPPFAKSRVRVSLSLPSPISIHLVFFLFFFNISIASSYVDYPATSSSSSPPHFLISYTDHCNSIVPESTPNNLPISPSDFLHFRNGYYIGGNQILGETPQSSAPKFAKAVSFRIQAPRRTDREDVLNVQGFLTFRGPNTYPLFGNLTIGGLRHGRFRTRRPRFPVRRNGRLRFNLQGFWDGSSGKLCMVGSGTGYSKGGNFLDLSVVFKLNYPKNSTIFTSLVSGKLESLGVVNSSNYFDPISVLAFSQRSYDYSFILNESKSGFSNGGDGNEKGLALGTELGQGIGRGICPILQSQAFEFELEYGSNCSDAKNCSLIGGGNGFLPNSMSFSGIQCGEQQNSLRLLMAFYNSSFYVYDQPLVPDRMLVGEGIWDGENNRLHVVGCRIMNFTDALIDASVGDCSIRLSLWFPAILSIERRSSAVGQIWSNRTMGDSGYFDKIGFRSSANRMALVPGLKYEYSVIDRVEKSCAEKKSAGKKRRKYPGGYSYDMRFDMRVGNTRGLRSLGYAVPLSVGDQFYERSNGIYAHSTGPQFEIARDTESAVQLSGNQSRIMNISYMISFTPTSSFKLVGRLSLTNMSRSSNIPVQIFAEGIYNSETGGLCMVGCRYLGSSSHNSVKNNSMDCEILINVQFPESNSKSKNFVKGSIKSTRGSSDPLYFENLEFTSVSMTTTNAVESVWRMDFEVTMVLITNTLICLFVGLQLFYVKKHPDVLPSISLTMLVILTLGHMIPLVLNFEALFLINRNRQNVLIGSGGWLEVNEVIVRVVTMIAFLLQSRLLQLTWSSRLDDENKNALWLAEKKAVYVFLPLCLVGGAIAWVVHWQSNSNETPAGMVVIDGYQKHSIWGDLRSYAGLLLDGFLLPQILLNVFWNSKDKALSPAFYFGTTAVRLLPHAYDLYRAHTFAPYFGDPYIYANHGGDFFSTAWDVIIPCGGLLFAIIIYFQQRFGGRCILPSKLRVSAEYEMVPVAVNGA